MNRDGGMGEGGRIEQDEIDVLLLRAVYSLDQFMLGGYPLGFWFAQQGSIYIFIALIIFYVVRMKKLERKYDLDD